MNTKTLDDLTPGSIRALSVLVQVNDDRGTPLTNWVSLKREGLHKGTVRALETRGVLKFNWYFDSVRLIGGYEDLARQAHRIFTIGPDA